MRIARVLPLATMLCLLAVVCSAKVRTRNLTYHDHYGTKLNGFLAWDDAFKGRRPGVLIVHDRWGYDKNVRDVARKLARAGYVTFALDIYGDGKVTSHPDSAKKYMAEARKEPATIPERFGAALRQLLSDQNVDSSRIGAIGYSFGGDVVLAMVRQGADLKAVATYSGALAANNLANPGDVKPKILVLTGGADRTVPATAVAAFEREMKDAGATYRVVTYPKAQNSFANRNASRFRSLGMAYNAVIARQAWREMIGFFKMNL